MSANLAGQLGRYQVDIYWMHDAKNFEEVATTASLLFRTLGADTSRATEAGRLVSRSYQLADIAEEAAAKNDVDGERKRYRAALLALREVEKVLGRSVSVADEQLKWWVCFRHRRMVCAAYHILAQHIKACGTTKIGVALRLSADLICVGVGHNRRDKDFAVRHANKYWSLLLRSVEPDRYPYLG